MSEFPKTLTPELRDVLGLMIFHTAPVAHALRAGGETIARKAEDEQAFVLHWFICLALEHGVEWRTKAKEHLTALAAAMKEPGNDTEAKV